MKKVDNQPTLEVIAPGQTPGAVMARPQQSPALQLGGVDINALLNKALDSKAAVEIIKELRSMAWEDQQRAAKASFDRSLAAFQSECPVIKKEKFGAKNAYKYCPLDEMVPQVQPLLIRHGFSFTLSSDVADGFVKAIFELKHQDGHCEKSQFSVPIDSRNPMMNEQQRYGGAMTFAKRYAFCNALGIMTGDEDRDGATSKPRPAGPSASAQPQPEELVPEDITKARKRLWNLLKPIVSQVEGWDAKKWDGHNAWFREAKIITLPDTKVETLPLDAVQEIIDKANIVIGEM